MFKRILVAYDGSIHAVRALRIAVDISKKYDASLNVAMAVNLPDIPSGDEFSSEGTSYQSELDRAAEIARQENVPVVTHLLRGSVAETLFRFAEENSFDLVVVGARGRHAVKRFLLGSVSTHLTVNLDCPVLVVKEKNT
jgi:nucleotide-binding universal stress UspA family protein